MPFRSLAQRPIKRACDGTIPLSTLYTIAAAYLRSGMDPLVVKALNFFRPRAKGGCPVAMYWIGWACEHGYLCPRSEVCREPLYWYQRGFAKGHHGCAHRLAYMYMEGKHVDRCQQRGLCFLRFAAAKIPEAQAQLGVCYREGNGVPQDHSRAFELFKQAAEANNPLGQYYLARCYELGEGTACSPAKAVELYQNMLERDKRSQVMNCARHRLALLLYFGSDQGASPEDHVEKDLVQAADHFRDGVANGYKRSFYYLGLLYLHGDGGLEVNKAEAERLWTEAAKDNIVLAIFSLAKAYEKGDFGMCHLEKAFQWYRQAANLGHADSMARVGMYHLHGTVVPKNAYFAREWFQRSADGGSTMGRIHLAIAFMHGEGGPKCCHRGVELLRPAVASGSAMAKYYMSRCYAKGCGVSKCLQQARALLEEAVAGGYHRADICLAKELMHACGGASEEDLVRSRQLLERAVSKGSPEAKTLLAECYMKGWGGPVKYCEAKRLYAQAAEKGNMEAMMAYREILIGEGDWRKSHTWLHKMAMC
ncbi:esiB, partial [Symbiodinium sp. KB8]